MTPPEGPALQIVQIPRVAFQALVGHMPMMVSYPIEGEPYITIGSLTLTAAPRVPLPPRLFALPPDLFRALAWLVPEAVEHGESVEDPESYIVLGPVAFTKAPGVDRNDLRWEESRPIGPLRSPFVNARKRPDTGAKVEAPDPPADAEDSGLRMTLDWTVPPQVIGPGRVALLLSAALGLAALFPWLMRMASALARGYQEYAAWVLFG